jgi:hypothetical protein
MPQLPVEVFPQFRLCHVLHFLHGYSFLAIAAFAQKTLVSNSVNATDRSRDGGHSWVIMYANSFAFSRRRS